MSYIRAKEEENSRNHIERYGSLPINFPKRKIATRGEKNLAGKITAKRIGGTRMEIPLCKVELGSKWKTGPIIVGVMDSLTMKGITLLLGKDVRARTTFPWKRTKLSATNGRDKTTIRVEKGHNLRNRSRGEEMEVKFLKLENQGKN